MKTCLTPGLFLETELNLYKSRYLRIEEEWPRVIKQAMNFIHAHMFNSQLSVERVKSNCRISDKSLLVIGYKSYAALRSVFKRYQGCSPRNSERDGLKLIK